MNDILMGFVGDVIVNREDPHEAFKEVADVLQAPDIMFGHLENSYSDNPQPAPGSLVVVGAPAHNLSVLAQSGFDVMSLAGNHILDIGYEAMLETRARLESQGVKTCGAGESEAAARAPAIVDAKGIRVAFLAYASVFPMGYEAFGNRPGLAPVRSYNLWRDAFPGYYQPGCPAALTMVPDESDLRKLSADIAIAHRNADLVVTSFHWGDFSRPFHVTEHEKTTARFCIDNGADMVVGHHQHTLRGIEWYKEKPILYGVGHLVADMRFDISDEIKNALRDDGGEEVSYRVGAREGWPLLPLHKDSRMALIAFAHGNCDGIGGVAVLPCRLRPDGVVYPLRLASEPGKEVIEYLKMCNSTQGFKAEFVVDNSWTVADFNVLRLEPA